MTFEELNELIHLRKEIERDQERIARAEAQATSSVGNYDGIGGSSGISDKVGDGAVRLAVLTSVYREHIELKEQKRDEALRYIENVEESYIRDIMKMRFIDGMKWYQIAMELNQSGASSVQNAVIRYLERQNGKEITDQENN